MAAEPSAKDQPRTAQGDALSSSGTGGPVSLSGLTLADAQDKGIVAPSVSSTSDGGSSGSSKGSPIAVVQESPIDKTRQRLAFILLGALLVIIAVEMVLSTSFAARCWSGPKCTDNLEPAMRVMSGAIQPLFTAMVGLVGSVVGFYFGSKNA